MKHLLPMAVLLAGASAWAAPSVTIDRVQQRYPWNGMVDIDYTVSDIANPDVYEIDLDVTDATGRLWDTVTLLAKPDTTVGSHRLTWNSAADNAQFLARQATFKLNLRQVSVATDGDYMVIDLSRGTDAPVYNVTYLSDIADPTNYFNTTEYKTTKIVLKRIKAGSYWMGSPDGGEAFGKTNEKYHYVTLTNDFYVGMFLLTGGQYVRVVGGEMPEWTAEEKALTGNIGGCDALAKEDGFLARLNARARNALNPIVRFGFPTESQWEYACRAGTTTTWFFGEDSSLLSNYAYFDNATPPRVGAKAPNPWCLWDVYGTVQEYTQDTLDDKFNMDYPDTTEENPDVEPLRVKGGGNRAMRGGASWNDAAACRSAFRASSTSGTKSVSNGFRLCISCHGSGGVTE